jgi:hypothetical protein
MLNISEAQYAIQALNGTIMFEGGLPLQVNFILLKLDVNF